MENFFCNDTNLRQISNIVIKMLSFKKNTCGLDNISKFGCCETKPPLVRPDFARCLISCLLFYLVSFFFGHHIPLSHLVIGEWISQIVVVHHSGAQICFGKSISPGHIDSSPCGKVDRFIVDLILIWWPLSVLQGTRIIIFFTWGTRSFFFHSVAFL